MKKASGSTDQRSFFILKPSKKLVSLFFTPKSVLVRILLVSRESSFNLICTAHEGA